ncbi:glycosyl hydrolase [Purpureocillium lavendulum]|uniref:Glycosyl hydrolase n=1 Tax=Purpureocillium lavendulum TaxID=1247861 RepID=A0AB34FQQ6_9HYPO|nr:glycosyl hydrolase [Purpureocillium lavendulum]
MSALISSAGRVATAGLRLKPSAMSAALCLRAQHLAVAPPHGSTSTRAFSASTLRCSKQHQPGQPHTQQDGNPELPAFSLNGLGASKGVKTAIIVILCIFGTMETWMWCKWAWNWWKGSDGEEAAK